MADNTEEILDEIYQDENNYDDQEPVDLEESEDASDLAGKDPAQTVSVAQSGGTQVVQPKTPPPDLEYIKNKIDKIETEINSSMHNCSDVERLLIPVIKESDLFVQNITTNMARGEKEFIYKLISFISKFSSVANTSIGHIKNVKFEQYRAQQTLDDIKERISKEEV